MTKKIALIGCGIWGKKLLLELVILGASVDVYESDKSLETVARDLGAVGFFGTLGSLSKYDGVILSTPSSTHRSLLEQILPYGIPVFVEKPLTTNLQDALALERLNTDKLFLMHIWTYHPGILLLRDIAHSGEMGKLLSMHSRRANWTSPRTDTDTVWNLSPHDITIAKVVLGYIPEPRFAVAEKHEGTIRSFTAILGKDPFFIFDVSNRYEGKIRQVRLNFERGVAIFENDEAAAIRILHGDARSTIHELQIEDRRYSDTTAMHLELLDFISYLDGGPAPRATFKEGLEVAQTIHQLLLLAEDLV